eukprot:Transcript_21677.p1 GENE.Transcript_21677~~Transcript_21677.p1  ORF type:complete len:326 (+),score=32.56 Transcript_21677:79-978(+)
MGSDRRINPDQKYADQSNAEQRAEKPKLKLKARSQTTMIEVGAGASIGSRASRALQNSDLRRFHPSVVHRVYAQTIAKTDRRVQLLQLVEERTSSRAALAVHALLALFVLASVVILVLVATVDWSSPDHVRLSLVDLSCASLLAAEWLVRCGLYVMLRCSSDETIRSLAPAWQWLIVDGIASSAHVLTASFAFAEFGDELAVDMIACLRVLRLISLARSYSTTELVLEVLWQSCQALKGPIYFLAVSTVIFAIVVFYVERLLAPDTAGFDTLGNAIWYSWVTFSTGQYGARVPPSNLVC